MPHALVLLASASRVDALHDWLDRQALTVAGFPLLASAELAALLGRDPRTAQLAVVALEALSEGGDIQVAARVLAGEVGLVVALLDPEAPLGMPPDGRLLITGSKEQREELAARFTADVLVIVGRYI